MNDKPSAQNRTEQKVPGAALPAARRKPSTGQPQARDHGMATSVPLSRQLQATAAVVQAVRAGRSLTTELASVSPELRPGVQALTFQVMRQLGRAMALRERLASKAPPPAADALLCTALALSWQGEGAPYPVHTLVNQAVEAARQQRQTAAQSGFINACLRRFLREREDLVAETDSDPQARWNHPRWWVARVQDEYPEDWQQLLDMAQQAAPMSLRVDTRHHSVAAYQAQLQALGLGAKAVGASGLQLESAVPVHQLPGFDLGHVSVQDAAAQVAAPLLLQGLDEDRPWRILDACAAPGGKTGHLLACYPQAQVLALDVDAMRCQRIEDNLKRLGAQAQARAQVRAADAAQPAKWWDGVAFDAILLDAPCTASGIVRRHPDVRWLRRPGDSAQLAQTQAKLLKALWPLLAPGGRLLYCTCSVFRSEGEDTVQAFLQRNTQARLLPSPGHLIPGKIPTGLPLKHNALGEHDGFYYALLEKDRD